jgi:hypothetical protein
MGKTLLTITGTNFSIEELENTVIIGDRECVIQEYSESIIKCETPLHGESGEDVEYEVEVFLKLMENAGCEDIENSCMFLYRKDKTPVVSDMVVIEEDAGIRMVVSGSGFDLAQSAQEIKVCVEDIQQSVESYDDASIVVRIDSIQTMEMLQVLITFVEVGYAMFQIESKVVLFLYFL